MRIIPYNGEENLEDIESLSIIIKAVPFEKSFVPAFFIQSHEEEYPMSLDELNCFMDGIEIAHKNVDHIISFLLQRSFDKEDKDSKDEDGEF
jgi:hypothetical protein